MKPFATLLFVFILLLNACGDQRTPSTRGENSGIPPSPNSTPVSNGDSEPSELTVGITGKVLYSTESPSTETETEEIVHELNSTSSILIELRDTSLMDAPSELVHGITLEDIESLPTPYVLSLEGFSLELGRTYSLSALVDLDQSGTTSAGDLLSVWSHSLTDEDIRTLTEETPGVVQMNIHVESL